eukprot:SAG11_NODE_1785_length_4258_cov_5.997836_1_plen_134_part_10
MLSAVRSSHQNPSTCSHSTWGRVARTVSEAPRSDRRAGRAGPNFEQRLAGCIDDAEVGRSYRGDCSTGFWGLVYSAARVSRFDGPGCAASGAGDESRQPLGLCVPAAGGGSSMAVGCEEGAVISPPPPPPPPPP